MSPRKATAEAPKLETAEVELNLFCDLTQEELTTKGHRLAEALTEVRRLEAAKKEAAAQVKGEIETLQGEIRDLVQVVRDKREKRMVSCRVEILDGQRFIYRKDTEESVEINEISIEDRQLVLPLGK